MILIRNEGETVWVTGGINGLRDAVNKTIGESLKIIIGYVIINCIYIINHHNNNFYSKITKNMIQLSLVILLIFVKI